MNNDAAGKHLDTLLSGKKSVKIITANGNWIRNFYLPIIEQPRQNERRVLFVSLSDSHSFVHYNNKTLQLDRGATVAFTNVNGTWDTLDDPTGKNIN